MPYNVIVGRDDSDKKKFGDAGLVRIGKGYVKMGQYTSLSNPIYLDVARSHVILVAGKRGCLVENTLIFTDKGYKEIKDFDEKEDKVFSFNKESKKFEWEKAELLKYPIKNEELLEIKFENGKHLILTKEHPLLAVTGNKLLSLLWVKAENMKVGDELLGIGNSSDDLVNIKIKSIKEVKDIKEVYDLSVDKNHSFIANGIISHNSGKSYTLGVIAEEISQLPDEARNNIAPLIFDTMGIFWTMKYENEKEKELLEEWELKPKKLPVRVFAPYGYFEEYKEKGVDVDFPFALKVSEMASEDWILLFELDIIEPVSVLIQRVIFRLDGDFDIEDILNEIRIDREASAENKSAAIGLFEAASTWGVFARKGDNATEIKDLVKAGETSIIDLSAYNSVGAFNVRALVIGLVCRKLFKE